MVDEFDEEEEMRLPKKKKNEKKGSRATIDGDTTLGKRKKKSKWWEHFSIDEENPAFASSIKFKRAFASLYMKDSSCLKELRKFGGGPNEDDWKRVGSFLPFLSVFYDATLRLSGSRYVTCNSYAHEIYGTRLMISNNMSDDDEGVKKMAAQMMSKHEGSNSEATGNHN
ncbi:hypothetical protein V6N12_068215 [Hibiscus sabdariffa]|uniref:Uncharacterized protein n=1 Tax=Hibiscus sabdariffa TaxID=183260 RepID=A0ABR2FPC6_9ROSI